jgi:hypothetical protein
MITSAPDFYLRLAGGGDGSVRAFQCPAGYCTACDQAALDQAAAAAAAGAMSLGLSRNGTTSGNRTEPGSVTPLASVVTCCASHRDPSSALCGRCAPGFEDWSGTCKRCTRSNPGLIVAFITLSTLLVAWLAHSASNASVGLTAIGLYFVQTASLEFGPAAGMLAWLQAINFNPGQFSLFAQRMPAGVSRCDADAAICSHCSHSAGLTSLLRFVPVSCFSFFSFRFLHIGLELRGEAERIWTGGAVDSDAAAAARRAGPHCSTAWTGAPMHGHCRC